ncbi:MAG: thiamine biosynthesis protein ThiF [Deltaproteobacteria bacterium]|nr:MAG: thiamine biosynthesis protein ThiF [Deltaproteobacteria bacterium]
MNEFEKGLLQYLDEKALCFIGKQKIGILGAGGLGSNCAFNLVRCGFKRFIIVDFDRVDASNLNRQFYFIDQIGKFKTEALRENLLKINPDIEIELINKKIDSKTDFQLFVGCDAVIEGFDNSFYKKSAAEFFINKNIFLVCGSGIAGYGKSDEIKTRQIRDLFFMAGDFKTGVDDKNYPYSPCVNITAAKQADIVFSWFLLKGGF